jgi:hypothetical protein
MHNDGKWFLFSRDTLRIVFFTFNLLGLHVRVGSVQHPLLGLKCLQNHSVYSEVKVVTDVGLEYI